MVRSLSARRWPALTLALLAMWGLLLRGQVMPAMAADALPGLPRVAICHSGPDQRRPPDHQAADCDACLLCQLVHGDHAGTALLPRGPALPLPWTVTLTTVGLPAPVGKTGNSPLVPRARAPPAGP
jgi:hypothetical protein